MAFHSGHCSSLFCHLLLNMTSQFRNNHWQTQFSFLSTFFPESQQPYAITVLLFLTLHERVCNKNHRGLCVHWLSFLKKKKKDKPTVADDSLRIKGQALCCPAKRICMNVPANYIHSFPWHYSGGGHLKLASLKNWVLEWGNTKGTCTVTL